MTRGYSALIPRHLCRQIEVTFVLALLWGASAAALGKASIRGVVYDNSGDSFADAPILLTNQETGSRTRTRSAADGSYQFAALDSGTYRLSISMPCCALQSYSQTDIDLSDVSTLIVDVHLQQGDSLGTFGDDPATVADTIRSRQKIPDAPPPQMPDGKPDLGGVGHDEFPVDARPLPWAKQVADERVASTFGNHPHVRCLPGDPPIPSGGSPFITKFVQTEDLLIVLLEDVPGFRQIFMDGRKHPEDPNPSWLGYSIGRWEGETLIVETIGFNGRAWIGPYPSSESLRMIERYRRTEFGSMELEVTFEDPTVFEEPWVQRRRLDLAPQEELLEYVCENNKWDPGGSR